MSKIILIYLLRKLGLLIGSEDWLTFILLTLKKAKEIKRRKDII